MPPFVVRFGSGRARRYLAAAPADGGTGLRPFVWVPEVGRALTFPSAGDARAFGLAELGHALFDVGRCEAGA